MMRSTPLLALIALASALAPHSEADAQPLKPRIGFGFNSTLTTGDNLFGVGIHTRVAIPVNADLSIGAGGGLTGFVLSGRDEATYFLEPQIVAIVTINAGNPRSPYVLAGIGGYFPVGSKNTPDEGGPTLHGGLGWAIGLQSTAIYIEVNPALVIAKSSAELLLPVRFGIVL